MFQCLKIMAIVIFHQLSVIWTRSNTKVNSIFLSFFLFLGVERINTLNLNLNSSSLMMTSKQWGRIFDFCLHVFIYLRIFFSFSPVFTFRKLLKIMRRGINCGSLLHESSSSFAKSNTYWFFWVLTKAEILKNSIVNWCSYRS